MKKRLEILLISSLLLTGCQKDKFYDYGIEVINTMQEMMTNVRYDKYLHENAYVTSSEEVYNYFVSSDYSTPLNVFYISRWENNQAFREIELVSDLPSDLQDVRENFITFDTIIDHINEYAAYDLSPGMFGYQFIANEYKCIKTFENKHIDKEFGYLFTFEDAQPIFVNFYNSDKKEIKAKGTFLIINKYNINLQKAKTYFCKYGCEVEQLQ